jgi:hypothetical protein
MNYPRIILLVFVAVVLAIAQISFGNHLAIGGVSAELVPVLSLILVLFDREDEGLVLLAVSGMILELFSLLRFGTLLIPWLLVFGLATLLKRRYLLEVPWWAAGAFAGLAVLSANIPALLETSTFPLFFMIFILNGILGIVFFMAGKVWLPKRTGPTI